MKGEDTLMRTRSWRGAWRSARRTSGARRSGAWRFGNRRSGTLRALSLSLALGIALAFGGAAVAARGRLRRIGGNLAGLLGARHLDLGAVREPPEPGGDDAFLRHQAGRDHGLEIVLLLHHDGTHRDGVVLLDDVDECAVG